MIGRTNATHITKGGWIRPPEWLKIDHLITAGEQKTVGLYAVWDDDNVIKNRHNNYCCFKITGDYTVDWGDGSAPENFTSDAIAEHTYTYASISDSTIYDGYKQVIITITPQASSNITAYNFGVKHSADIYYYSSSNWLDMYVSGTHISYFTFWSRNKALFLKKFKAHQSTSAAMSMLSMFANCYSLQSVDLSSFNTSNVTNMSSMFSSCYSLQSIDLSSFNTSNVTNMSYMFTYCYSLQSVDLSSFDTSNVTNMLNMFNYCTSLQSIDLSSFNTSNVTNMSYMFSSCTSLQSIDLSSFDTSNVTNMSSMFYSCYSLQSIDLSSFDTSNVTNMSYMFANCYSLQSIDLSSFNTSNVTNMSYMFNYCTSLQSIDLSQTTLASVTDNTNITTALYTMSLCRLPNISKSFTVASSKLNAAALNALFGDLKDLTGFTAQSLTITACPGAATCNTTIATAKNWTIII